MTVLKTILFDEHLLLGAEMEEHEASGLSLPVRYPSEEENASGAYLCDLTGLPYGLLSGADAQSVAEMSCAGQLLEVGECAFEAVFFGDGQLVGIPFVFRSGEHEYCLIDLLGKDDACMEWILALSQLRHGEQRVFADVQLEDATEMLVPLLMWGNDAAAVLSDYLSGDDVLPTAGELRSVSLDRIQALVAGVPGLDGAFIVLVPPARARVLWRSFLSFSSVQPLGLTSLASKLEEAIGFTPLLANKNEVKADILAAHGLIRPDGQFVGMRGLLSR